MSYPEYFIKYRDDTINYKKLNQTSKELYIKRSKLDDQLLKLKNEPQQIKILILDNLFLGKILLTYINFTLKVMDLQTLQDCYTTLSANNSSLNDNIEKIKTQIIRQETELSHYDKIISELKELNQDIHDANIDYILNQRQKLSDEKGKNKLKIISLYLDIEKIKSTIIGIGFNDLNHMRNILQEKIKIKEKEDQLKIEKERTNSRLYAFKCLNFLNKLNNNSENELNIDILKLYNDDNYRKEISDKATLLHYDMICDHIDIDELYCTDIYASDEINVDFPCIESKRVKVGRGDNDEICICDGCLKREGIHVKKSDILDREKFTIENILCICKFGQFKYDPFTFQ